MGTEAAGDDARHARFPVGTILSIPCRPGSPIRQHVKVIGWMPLAGTGGMLLLRLLPDDDEKRDQETPQGEVGTGPVDDLHFPQ
jgi:hypothetical protein